MGISIFHPQLKLDDQGKLYTKFASYNVNNQGLDLHKEYISLQHLCIHKNNLDNIHFLSKVDCLDKYTAH